MTKVLIASIALLLSLSLSASESRTLEVYDENDELIDADMFVVYGRYTLVMLWSLDCPVCESQKPEIEKFYSKYSGSKAEVLAIATDNISNKKEILAQYGKEISYPNYIASNNFASNYISVTGDQILGTPTYLLYGPDRRMQGVHVGAINIDLLDSIIRSDTTLSSDTTGIYSTELIR